jgi:hypothetical protein
VICGLDLFGVLRLTDAQSDVGFETWLRPAPKKECDNSKHFAKQSDGVTESSNEKHSLNHVER